MKEESRLLRRTITEESVNRYCEWLYGCERSRGTIRQYRHYLRSVSYTHLQIVRNLLMLAMISALLKRLPLLHPTGMLFRLAII